MVETPSNYESNRDAASAKIEVAAMANDLLAEIDKIPNPDSGMQQLRLETEWLITNWLEYGSSLPRVWHPIVLQIAYGHYPLDIIRHREVFYRAKKLGLAIRKYVHSQAA
jgi:hypothetical protein